MSQTLHWVVSFVHVPTEQAHKFVDADTLFPRAVVHWTFRQYQLNKLIGYVKRLTRGVDTFLLHSLQTVICGEAPNEPIEVNISTADEACDEMRARNEPSERIYQPRVE